jgi:hypothetical protein
MPKRRAGEADEADGDDAGGAAEAPAAPPSGEQSTGKKGKFRKEKPWDVDGTDHWCAPAQRAASAQPLAHAARAAGKSSRFARRTIPAACSRRARLPRCSPSTEARGTACALAQP